jgi:flagellar secretion chaperone FliS
MFGSTQRGANAYAKVNIETGVSTASPHKLIVMLFEGALAAVATALYHMSTGNIPGKGQAISKAITIIDNGLRASLDKNVGGQIAENLDALYEYMSNQLLIANLRNQPALIEEVQRLLKDIKSAWDAIDPVNTMTQPAMEPPKVPDHDPLTPHTSRLMKA